MPNAKADQGATADNQRHWIDYAATIAAAAAAFAAACAAGVGFYQASISWDTEQRQLRAYVNPTMFSILTNATTNFVTVHVVLKNFGQTPARHVTQYSCLAIRPHKVVNGIDVSPTDLPVSYLYALITTKGVIPPLDTVNVFNPVWCDKASVEKPLLSNNTPLTSAESAALKASTSALYLYGEVSYVDAFGHPHITRYRVLTNDQLALGSNQNIQDTEGNCVDEDCYDHPVDKIDDAFGDPSRFP